MIPRSGRQVKRKTYYVLFSQGGQYKGCYTTVQASNYGGVEINEQRAKALIKGFGLQNVEEAFA